MKTCFWMSVLALAMVACSKTTESNESQSVLPATELGKVSYYTISEA
ncbi:MAG: hypothetical protein KDB18_13875 [Salinibacterium sp.]|nr:hypothetical protein [Planctomycetota bacterium]MCB1282606.1 hypothetical protein [Salinibacterium sp.]